MLLAARPKDLSGGRREPAKLLAVSDTGDAAPRREKGPAMTEKKPPIPANDHDGGPTTPAEEAARRAPDHVVTPEEKAKVAKEASREEDA